MRGGQRAKGYLPIHTTGEHKGEVIGQSGITFATGFDVGQLDKADLKRYSFPKDIEDKLLPFVSAKKEAARKLLPLAQKTVLSAQQLNLIDFKVKGVHLQSAIRSWDSRKQKGTPSFCELSPAQQTVLLSRTFHQGTGMPTVPVSQKFYQAALKNSWVAAENHLRSYHVTDKSYLNRVHNEADLLKKERLSK